MKPRNKWRFSLRAVLVVVTLVAVVLGVASWFPRQLASQGKPKAESRKPGQAESRKRKAQGKRKAESGKPGAAAGGEPKAGAAGTLACAAGCCGGGGKKSAFLGGA